MYRQPDEPSYPPPGRGRASLPEELPSLIDAIFSGMTVADIVESLRDCDVQTIIDVMDEVSYNLYPTQRVRRKCVKFLYKMCTKHNLFPRSLRFKPLVNTAGEWHGRGGTANVFRRESGSKEVAIKVLRTYDLSPHDPVNGFCKEVITWRSLQHPNVLPLLGVIVTENQFAMVSEWMTNGDINQYVAANSEVNKFNLLTDVTKGLMHMHRWGMIHADLKGANSRPLRKLRSSRP